MVPPRCLYLIKQLRWSNVQAFLAFPKSFIFTASSFCSKITGMTVQPSTYAGNHLQLPDYTCRRQGRNQNRGVRKWHRMGWRKGNELWWLRESGRMETLSIGLQAGLRRSSDRGFTGTDDPIWLGRWRGVAGSWGRYLPRRGLMSPWWTRPIRGVGAARSTWLPCWS